MKVSAAGVAAIRQREGYKLEAYRDSVGVWTIGVGHTGRMAPPAVLQGMRITVAECDAYLAADLAPVEAAINAVVTARMSQNAFDAMASLAFNIGVAGFRKSSVVRDLNAGKIDFAADAFLLWDHPAVLKGRREAERKQFLTPDDPSSEAASPAPPSAPVEPPAPLEPAAAPPTPASLWGRLIAALCGLKL